MQNNHGQQQDSSDEETEGPGTTSMASSSTTAFTSIEEASQQYCHRYEHQAATVKRPLPNTDTSSDINAECANKKQRSISLQYIDPSIYLTTVQRAPASHNADCVSLESLIGDHNLELMVQINYMIEVDFVMFKINESIRRSLRTIIYHGMRHTPAQIKAMENATRIRYPRVTLHKVPVPGIGTHHTKAMLLFYRDDTMQVVVHTANMIEQDWRNKTQAVFSTGRLPRKPQQASTCAFERDLIEYLQYYQDHHEFTRKLSQYDFSRVKGVLIGSVPGKFSGPDKNKWGHLRLRSVLRQQVEISQGRLNDSEVICQVSSVGSLGKESQDWLQGEFETSLNAHRNANHMNPTKANLCIVYPTAENVRMSFEGWTMGGSLPFRSTSYKKQAHYFKPLLHSWKAVKSGRERAMPHIKTFTRVTRKENDGDYLSWFLLTSANLSKPAWGEMKSNSVFSIQSYELGVLVFPGLYEDVNDAGDHHRAFLMNKTLDDPYPEPHFTHFTGGEETGKEKGSNEQSQIQQKINVVPIRLPYDLPLKKYDHSIDHVWLADKYFPGLDDFGNSLGM
ncbi:tyrosyl-DNA phosphodiesterase I [Lobosporangium transversale]|uniref:Tyrosyl-DNA phosphodiesterase I n=1 Tax=Lobosporangium transversale TaxID=64571 RepID=A0A1Y2H3V4_9FUNG|nr:tyrosyl-DNA phosphodiesterase I [Lobosporangium transversale]ORZ27742.1 tyrosyl-DNA phosphodiesterase I [Lobosporangium transversale]|eukprot:XP_021885445.1 tyrosyl-DNA phosphodiesterase I [Lobosporangium transversale]